MNDQLLYESNRSKVFLRSANGNTPQIIKILNIEFPTPEEIKHFYNEHEISSFLPETGVRRCIGKSRENGKHALLFDFVKGESLKKSFQNKQDDLIDFLHLAIASCEQLGKIHQKGIIHGDISPYNILVDLQERNVTIIDFSSAARVDYKRPFNSNPEKIQGNLAYISPEQTGRMNRIVDYRSDIYSLGVCFYEMLTGSSPFDGYDSLGIIHKQIAQLPDDLHLLKPSIPEPVSAIVMKMIQKNAEDRYQSAFGIQSDLEHCFKQLKDTGNIIDFRLAQNDFSGRFLLPQKLYGRKNEINSLIENFDECAAGKTTLALVSGYSGTGKSALVNEIHKPVTAKRGYFISGKFDQFQRSTPYFAILHAFKQLVQGFLTLKQDELENYATLIKETLGQEGQVLINVLPNIEHLIGPQPQLPEVGGSEAQSRFNYIFSKFVKAVCTPQHPLVLFIDDMQWADSASLQLLEVLLTDKNCKWLQCIMAYRDNEVSASHPAIQSIHRIKQSGVSSIDIQIGNLSLDNVNELISDATGLSMPQTADLAALVFKKTAGNAFFCVKFLKAINEENLLHFDYKLNRWTWDLETLKTQNVSDNVVEFLSGQIKRLPAQVIELLKFASCLGNTFSKIWVQQISGLNQAETDEALFKAMKAGLIIELDAEQFKFTHDRIQQSVYSLIAEEQKNTVHYTIGKRLLESTEEARLNERIFEITDQLNKGTALFTESEKLPYAGLNLNAGNLAKLNSAFHSAASYFGYGINLLPANAWQNQYSLALQLYSGACEAAYLNADFEQMEKQFSVIEQNAHNVLDKLKSYETRILALKAQNKLVDAVNTGLDLLEQLGEPLPRKPNMLHVFGGLSGLLFKLRNKHKSYFLSLPLMTDPYKIAAMRIIADITSSVYWAMPNLLPLVVFKMMNISMKHGNNAVSCFAYGSFGVILCGVLGFMKRGNEFGEISLELLDKIDAKEWKAQIYVSPYALTLHWRNHIDVTLKPLQESFHIGLETGLIEFACINTNIYCIHSFLSGKELTRLEEETKAYSDSYRQMKQETNVNYNEVYRQAMLNFSGNNKQPWVLTGDAFDEVKMLQQHTERNDKTGKFFIHFLKLMLAYHFKEYEKAYDEAQKARELLDAVLAKFEIPNHHFYEALTAIKLIETNKGNKLKLRLRIYSNARALKKWAKDAPMNFQHKYELIKAEKYRINNRRHKAIEYYELAIEHAAANRYIHEEALGRELTGRYYMSGNKLGLAEFYLRTASNLYLEWGALAKVTQLKEEFGSTRITLDEAPNSGHVNRHTTSSLSSSNLDFATFIKSASAISGEVVLSKLLSVLLKNVIENAGAQKGLLLLETEGKLLIQAVSDIKENLEQILIATDYKGSNLLSESIIDFTQRTSSALVLADAMNDHRFEKDPYLQANRVQSVMCIPINHQGKSIGILYLENRFTKGAFTQDRVELISLLSAQIAVSIVNAILYEQLEEKVNHRTEELRLEKQKSDELLYNILPFETAQEIKLHGSAKSRMYESATVLFTDFQGFTSISSKLTPNELVEELNICFKAFDQISEKYKIEKIKTIGDAYMAVGGIPIPNSVHAENTVKAALEIRDFIANRLKNNQGLGFQLRIGIHTGPVVAGIVGSKKFQYDIWGDTVNIAARMETNSEPGRINVSDKTYQLVKNMFVCEEREETEVKGKGKMKMYFVNELR